MKMGGSEVSPDSPLRVRRSLPEIQADSTGSKSPALATKNRRSFRNSGM